MSEEDPQSTCDVCDPRGQQKVAWCQQNPRKFVGSLITTLPVAVPAVLGETGLQTFSGSMEGSFQEIPVCSF